MKNIQRILFLQGICLLSFVGITAMEQGKASKFTSLGYSIFERCEQLSSFAEAEVQVDEFSQELIEQGSIFEIKEGVALLLNKHQNYDSLDNLNLNDVLHRSKSQERRKKQNKTKKRNPLKECNEVFRKSKKRKQQECSGFDQEKTQHGRSESDQCWKGFIDSLVKAQKIEKEEDLYALPVSIAYQYFIEATSHRAKLVLNLIRKNPAFFGEQISRQGRIMPSIIQQNSEAVRIYLGPSVADRYNSEQQVKAKN